MDGLAGINGALLVAGMFLLLCVLASKASTKLGVPALVVFLALGMLAGSDGPGRIPFDNFEIASYVGSVALAFILFSGGLDSNWTDLRRVARPGLLLATLGVLVTAGLVGLFAHFFLGLPITLGLLLGAVVSSTDAAAIFGVLRGSGFRLKHRITPLLEFESGANDALAVFLVVALTQVAVDPNATAWGMIPSLLVQMPLGAAIGYVVGLGAVWAINRIRLEYDGLYPVVTVAAACLAFGGAGALGGNPFLSVYVAGVALGSRTFVHRISLRQFHDAAGWLMQIVMFVLLGLLSFPSQLPPVALSALALSLFLIFVARPVAVAASLAPFRIARRAQVFVAWAGLRGAVPIVLATIPVVRGVPNAVHLFHLVFFIVLTSVLLQGTLLRPLARALRVLSPIGREPAEDMREVGGKNLLETTVAPGSPADGSQVVELRMPPTALLVLLTRDGRSYVPRGSTVLAAGDRILIATRRDDEDEILARFG
ncbi:MAG: potassium/proton antiporter [Fimbriimonadaceae bacterium]|nr:potassium/proton antiporter [Fimbriimonadaceae bacterium]QYK55882.1 MAG: potassium/proton antiporter [Fimbriimonadaceae bacterium]